MRRSTAGRSVSAASGPSSSAWRASGSGCGATGMRPWGKCGSSSPKHLMNQKGSGARAGEPWGHRGWYHIRDLLHPYLIWGWIEFSNGFSSTKDQMCHFSLLF
ncbi:hypothetical protein CIB84_012143 [Bambusicola thoracicus]|uniref:Uncharacterized protein n=1 Tax=Bambusicola thoracicus TaxID=9083 RepID=A0A2P4SJ20_BAMTH|nr:hypothetical protein CIB84_012143 [Bambusicola thoracicus]